MMKRVIIACLVLLINWCTPLVHADQYDADRHQMKIMLEDIRTKLNHPEQLSALAPYFDDNAIITFYDARTVIGPKGLLKYMDTMVTGSHPVLKSYKVFGSEITPATVYANNTATAYGWIQNRFDFVNGESITVDGHWTTSLIKLNNQWKIVTLQFTSNLFDNPLINTMEHKLIYFIVIGLIGGIVLSFIVRHLVARRSGKVKE